MKPPPTSKEVQALTDWDYAANFTDADGKTVVPGDWVQLTRDLPAYGDRDVLVAPAGWAGTVVAVSGRSAIASLNGALGDEQSVAVFEKTSRLHRARTADRLKEVKNDA